VTTSPLQLSAGSGVPGRYVLSDERTGHRGDRARSRATDSRRIEWDVLSQQNPRQDMIGKRYQTIGFENGWDRCAEARGRTGRPRN
jgi:hypothetical protein